MDKALFVTDEGAGTPVLLLHGQPGSSEDMVLIAERLGSSARVLNLDRFGYGRSQVSAQSLRDQADSYVALLRDRHAVPAIVVGHSFGGGIALLMAARHPKAISALVLVASIGGKGSITLGDQFLAAPFVGPMISTLSLLAYERLAPFLGRLSRPSRLVRNIPSVSKAISSQDRRAFLFEQRSLLDERGALDDAVKTVACAVTAITGDRDLIIPQSAAFDLAKRLGDVKLVTLKGQGHLIPRDAPEKVAEEIQHFLEGRETGNS